MKYIGIDPGVSGSICVLEADGTPVGFHKMPATERDLLDVLEQYGPRATGPCAPGAPRAFALLERVSASPQMGVVSAFTFGQGYGRLLMGLTAARIPFNWITPATWQRYMQCLSRGDKNVTKRRAQQLFPHLTVTHAIADGLLIAELCRRLAQQGALGVKASTPEPKDPIDGKEEREEDGAGEEGRPRQKEAGHAEGGRRTRRGRG